MERDDGELLRAIEIEDVAHGGDGVGRMDDGRVIFVPRTLPGEVVDVEVVETDAGHARGRPVEWQKESAHRTESDCPYFSECGGCRYWHVEYERELELKVDAARQLVERNAGVGLPTPEVHPAPADRRYRNRATFHRRPGGDDGESAVGFFGRESHELVTIEDCLVGTSSVNEARRRIEPALDGLGAVEVRVETADETSAVVTIEATDEVPAEPTDRLVAFAERLAEVPSIRGVRLVGDEREWVGGDDSVDGSEVMASPPVDSIRLPAGLFRQANSEVNRRMVDRVRRRADEWGPGRVLELFCGVGNFSFELAEVAEALLGVEGDEVAVEMAETMAEFTGREDLLFIQKDLGGGFTGHDLVDDFPIDTVVLDPPRGGARDVCDELAAGETAASSILYVSCDPGALGRDLDILGSGGWEVDWLEAFDMFPRTSHVELVAGLRAES